MKLTKNNILIGIEVETIPDVTRNCTFITFSLFFRGFKITWTK